MNKYTNAYGYEQAVRRDRCFCTRDLTLCFCQPILQIGKLRLMRLHAVTCPRSLGQVRNSIGLSYNAMQPLQLVQLGVRDQTQLYQTLS